MLNVNECENEEEDKNDDLHQLVLQCIQFSNDLYQGTIEDQQKASDFFYGWIQHPKAFIIGLEILENFDDLYSNYAALTVFNVIILNNWNFWDPNLREKLKYILYEILQSDRSAPLINLSSLLIARIAIFEFPEYWKDFLNDSLLKGNSLLLTHYLEILENNPYIPQNRRVLIHQIFIASFDFIKNAVFDRLDISPQAIQLYSLISRWMPLTKIINEKAINLLTTTLLDNELTRLNAIECLDVIFVQRCDFKDEFAKIHNLLMKNLQVASAKYAECARLMANILTSHLNFFGKANEIIETVKVPIELKTTDIDNNGDEIMVFNLCLPKYESKKIVRKTYPFYESFQNCFLILANPGWCLKSDLNSDENKNDDNTVYINDDENDGNANNIYYESGPELYWSTWRKFFVFADGLECEKDGNFILKNIPMLFYNLASFVITAIESRMIINDDARVCFSIMIKNEPQFVISQLTSKELSVDLLYATCCCIDKMSIEFANQFVLRFLVPNQDSSMLIHNVQCIAFFLRFLPENCDIIQFFIETFTFSMNIQPQNESLRLSAISALAYISKYSPKVFYFGDFTLMQILESLIEEIEPDNSLLKSDNQLLFEIAARVISSIDDDEISTKCIKKVLKKIFSFVFSKCESILGRQQDSNIFSTFICCINLLNDFSRRCFRLAQAEGQSLLELCYSIIFSKSSNKRDLELISSCYELSESIILCSINWEEAEPLTNKILEVTLSGAKNQFGFAIKFMTNIHQKFKDSISLFPLIYENIVTYLMSEITDDSQFVLDYLLTVKFWYFNFQLPIEFMKEAINNFPLICAKTALIITKEYFINYQKPYISTYILNNGQIVFRFLTDILTNSFFNVYFHDIVRCFMSFFFAINHLDVDLDVVNFSLVKILHEVIPNININNIMNENYEMIKEQNLIERYFFFMNFLQSCQVNYLDQHKMELELRNLVTISHCCLPVISDLYSISEIKNPIHSDIQNKSSQENEIEIEELFDDIKDEDFEF